MSEAAKVNKSEEEWRKKLTPEQYHVLREKGTEVPFSGKYAHTKDKGMYRCAGCGNPLFSSDTKFESGTGWPSFYAPVSADAITTASDRSFEMERTEVLCAKCGGHLGHVFDASTGLSINPELVERVDDGPTALPDGRQATGKRYCINSVALDLEPEKKL